MTPANSGKRVRDAVSSLRTLGTAFGLIGGALAALRLMPDTRPAFEVRPVTPVTPDDLTPP